MQDIPYTLDDIVIKRGHVYTSDGKYYLAMDGGYDYWHKIKSREGDKLKLSYWLGDYSTDFCFRCDIPACTDKLNKLIQLRGN